MYFSTNIGVHVFVDERNGVSNVQKKWILSHKHSLQETTSIQSTCEMPVKHEH